MGLFPRAARQLLDAQGIPGGPNAQIYIVDPQTGDDNNPGTSFEQPLLTVAAAEDLCVTNQNDAVVMVGGPNADTVTSIIAWDKDFTHLVGMSAPLPGVGQRCRINALAANDVVNVMTISGDGCMVKNIQFTNESNADVDSGALIVSGDRNHFENCFMAGMVHVTPAARAGSYSMTITGSECGFKDCAFGLDTIVRAAANSEVIIGSGAVRNLFQHCRFSSASETAGKFLVNVAAGAQRWHEFEDCLFYNFSVNHAITLANAFNMDASGTHDIIFRGKNMLVGIDGLGDTVTSMWIAEPVPNGGAGIAINPTS